MTILITTITLAVGLSIVLAWFMGVEELVAGGHKGLAIVAVSGVVLVVTGFTAFVGFVLPPRPGSKSYDSADGWTRARSNDRYPHLYQAWRSRKGLPTQHDPESMQPS